MKEFWTDVAGYEGLYQISNLGNIKSKDRYKRNGRGCMVLKGKILKPHPNSRGYLRVQLVDKNGAREYAFVHRLVALHFVHNSDAETNKIVNHIDSNFLNNKAVNLEWTTYRGNTLHAVRNGRMNRTEEWLRHLRETKEKSRKRVVGVNIKTGAEIHFVCLNDCKNAGFQPSCVCDCCKGKRSTHGGYKWQYE